MRTRLSDGGFGVRMTFSAFVLITVLAARAGGPWYVATNGVDTGNDGLSWSQPLATISNALAKAGTVKNETIWVSNGVYALSASVDNPAAKACKIRAWSTHAADTVLQGPGTGSNIRGVTMDGAGSLLEGFTVRNFCVTNMNCAGVYCKAGLVKNCVVANNMIDGAPEYNSGGGVYLIDGGAIADSTITGNLLGPNMVGNCRGAGIFAYNSGTITNCEINCNTNTGKANANGGGVWVSYPGKVMNCRIMGNWAKHMGGGIYASGTGINIQDCIVASNTSSGADGGIAGGEVISNNYASIHTGGIYCDLTETNVLISGCTIVNNRNATGANGGLLVLESQKVVIRNCLMANNSGTLAGWSDRGTSGGGLCVTTSTTNGLIENCTIASNRINQTGSVVGYGAGLYVDGGVRVVNSIVYQNIYTGGAGTSSNVYASEDCVFNNSCTAPLTGLTGTSNTDADPQFVSTETGNFRLKGGSPCINAGLYSAWMQGTVDLDGSRRISGSQVDIGAFEYIFKGTFIRVW